MAQNSLCMYCLCVCLDQAGIRDGPSNVTAKVKNTVQFHCNVTGYPNPTVTWLLNGAEINTTSRSELKEEGKYRHSWDRSAHVLTIADVQYVQDGNRYSCRAVNAYGAAESNSAFLLVQGTRTVPRRTDEWTDKLTPRTIAHARTPHSLFNDILSLRTPFGY